MNKILPLISIVFSLAALTMSIAAYSKISSSGPTQEEINKMIVAELDARDRARIAIITPKAKAIYRDMLGSDKFNPDTFAPTTYEELFAPFVSIVNGLTAQP